MKTSAPTARLRMEPALDGFGDEPGPRFDAELGEDVDQVRLDGGARHEQAGRDLGIGEVLADQAHNL